MVCSLQGSHIHTVNRQTDSGTTVHLSGAYIEDTFIWSDENNYFLGDWLPQEGNRHLKWYYNLSFHWYKMGQATKKPKTKLVNFTVISFKLFPSEYDLWLLRSFTFAPPPTVRSAWGMIFVDVGFDDSSDQVFSNEITVSLFFRVKDNFKWIEWCCKKKNYHPQKCYS